MTCVRVVLTGHSCAPVWGGGVVCVRPYGVCGSVGRVKGCAGHGLGCFGCVGHVGLACLRRWGVAG